MGGVFGGLGGWKARGHGGHEGLVGQGTLPWINTLFLNVFCISQMYPVSARTIPPS
jgi:hypothetical protein